MCFVWVIHETNNQFLLACFPFLTTTNSYSTLAGLQLQVRHLAGTRYSLVKHSE